MVACQKVQRQEVTLVVSLPEMVADSANQVVNKDSLMADIRQVVAQRLEVDDKDIMTKGPALLVVNLPVPVDTASIDRLLSQKGEFGFWETVASKDITCTVIDGSKKMKDGDKFLKMLHPVSDDYCAIGYVLEKDTAEVNRFFHANEMQQMLGSDILLCWAAQEEENAFVDIQTDYGSDPRLFALFALRGPAPVISGEKIIEAKDEMDPYFRAPIVTMKMNEEGARQFADMTKKNIGRAIAIVLDGRVFSAPKVNMEITGGNASITGQYTPEQTKELARILRSGVLKGSVKVKR